VYGIRLASDYDFVSSLPPTTGPPDVSFSCTTLAPRGIDWAAATVVEAQGRRADGASVFVFARFPDHAALRITGAADFHIWPDRVVCHVVDERHQYLVEIALFGMVLALWLELQGVPTMHASAAVIDGHAVAFLGSRGGGKTSTAAACVASGHELLTDDLLAIEERDTQFLARPGYPMLRLWPEQAEWFVGGRVWEKLPIVHPDVPKRRVPVGMLRFDSFRDRSSVLHRVYLLERSDDAGTDIRITAVRPTEAVMALLRHSFLPREVERYGLQGARMEQFASLAAVTPVARLRYPAGFDRLPAVVEAIVEDVNRS
jgi:hypothetical protein